MYEELVHPIIGDPSVPLGGMENGSTMGRSKITLHLKHSPHCKNRMQKYNEVMSENSVLQTEDHQRATVVSSCTRNRVYIGFFSMHTIFSNSSKHCSYDSQCYFSSDKGGDNLDSVSVFSLFPSKSNPGEKHLKRHIIAISDDWMLFIGNTSTII